MKSTSTKSHDQDLTLEFERELVGELLVDPTLLDHVLEIVKPGHLLSGEFRVVLGAMAELQQRGQEITLPRVADTLKDQGNLDVAGGFQGLAQLVDNTATTANVEELARAVGVHHLKRRATSFAQQIGDDPTDRELHSQLEATADAIEEAQAPFSELNALGFSGDNLRAIRERPERTSPLPGILDPEPHLHVLQGKPKVAKTTFGLNLARAWCQKISPWDGAPDLPGSRTLIISREQPISRVDAVLRRLSVFADRGSIERWTDRITIVARDPELQARDRKLLCLDDDGLQQLRAVLRTSNGTEDPFGLLILDSLSRLKSPAVEEIDNDAMTVWLDQLEDIAVEFAIYVILIHHVGHSTDPSRQEARSAGRGASSIAAVAQVAMLLDRVAGQPRQRLLKVDGNAVLSNTITFEVCGEDAEPGSVHLFRPVDALAHYDIDNLLGEQEEISTTQLAWKIAGKKPEPKKRPPGKDAAIAKELRIRWERDGLIDVTPGSHGALMMRRKASEER